MDFWSVLRILAGSVCGAVANLARMLMPFETVFVSGFKRRVVVLKSSQVLGADALGNIGNGILAPGSAHHV